MIRNLLLSSAAATLLPAAAFAQAPPAETVPPAQDEAQADEQDRQDEAAPPAPRGQGARSSCARRAADHRHRLRATPDDVLSGISVVTGEELARDLRPTIGETLARQAGVSATSFGPNASRPVLRGFQGERVRILTDGIGSLDASNTSVDHAVAINPLTAERIEVLRGPSALLFGSAAIGGVVNVIDARIPRRVPDEAVHVEGIATYGSAADERSVNAAIDVPIAGHFVVHVDGNYSKTDDLGIGGFVLARALRAAGGGERRSGDPGARRTARPAAQQRRPRPPTWPRASPGSAATANVGFSVNRYDSLYGVPVRFSLDPAVEAEAPRIDIRQTRDGRPRRDRRRRAASSISSASAAAIPTIAISSSRTPARSAPPSSPRAGRAGSRRSSRRGAAGAAASAPNISAATSRSTATRSSCPRTAPTQFGLFALQTFELGAFKAEAGARYEHQPLSAEADAGLGNPAMRRSFDAFSGSLGASYELAPGHPRRPQRLAQPARALGRGTVRQRPACRHPVVRDRRSGSREGEELGPRSDLPRRPATATASPPRSSTAGSTTTFTSSRPALIEDDLPVFEYRQADARYFGVELEGSVRLARIGGFTLNADAVADYVRATIDGVGPAPRIPPLRLLGGLEAQSDKVSGRIEVEWVSDQDRLAAFETPTDGHTLVNASLAFEPFGHRNTSITLSANNIFDVDARRHASFLKDYAPLAGRDIRLSARVIF